MSSKSKHHEIAKKDWKEAYRRDAFHEQQLENRNKINTRVQYLNRKKIKDLGGLANVLVVGKQHCGKTTYLIQYMMVLILLGVRQFVAFNGLEKSNHVYEDFGIPKKYIRTTWDDQFISQIMWLQSKLIEKVCRKYNVRRTKELADDIKLRYSTVIVIDDMSHCKRDMERSVPMKKLIYMTQHLLIYVVFACHSSLIVPSAWRSQFDIFMSRRVGSEKDFHDLFHHYFSLFESYNQFKATHMNYTQGWKVLICDNTKTEASISNQYGWDESIKPRKDKHGNFIPLKAPEGQINYKHWDIIKREVVGDDGTVPEYNSDEEDDDDGGGDGYYNKDEIDQFYNPEVPEVDEEQEMIDIHGEGYDDDGSSEKQQQQIEGGEEYETGAAADVVNDDYQQMSQGNNYFQQQQQQQQQQQFQNIPQPQQYQYQQSAFSPYGDPNLSRQVPQHNAQNLPFTFKSNPSSSSFENKRKNLPAVPLFSQSAPPPTTTGGGGGSMTLEQQEQIAKKLRANFGPVKSIAAAPDPTSSSTPQHNPFGLTKVMDIPSLARKQKKLKKIRRALRKSKK